MTIPLERLRYMTLLEYQNISQDLQKEQNIMFQALPEQ